MTENTIEAYPLCWPNHRPRTDASQREYSLFKTSFSRASRDVIQQIGMMRGTDLIISTNIALRRDGFPMANRNQPEDSGVAVYFTYNKRQMCFACDRWRKVEENMQALAKTIEALRGIARWGSGDMMEAAFTGFTALPAPGQTSARGWREILGLPTDWKGDIEEVYAAWKVKRSAAHPDNGGSTEAFHAVQTAYEQATQELAK